MSSNHWRQEPGRERPTSRSCQRQSILACGFLSKRGRAAARDTSDASATLAESDAGARCACWLAPMISPKTLGFANIIVTVLRVWTRKGCPSHALELLPSGDQGIGAWEHSTAVSWSPSAHGARWGCCWCWWGPSARTPAVRAATVTIWIQTTAWREKPTPLASAARVRTTKSGAAPIPATHAVGVMFPPGWEVPREFATK